MAPDVLAHSVEQLPPPELSRCGVCGYMLEGLAAQGRCPECSSAFDRTEIVLLGRPAGPRSEYWFARPGLSALFAGFLAAVGVQLHPLIGWSLLAVVLAPAIYLFLRRTFSPELHEVVVRMNSAGVGMKFGPCEASTVALTGWARVTRLRLVPKRGGRVWIWVRCDDLDLFDAVVHCPRDMMPQLQARIAQWFRG